MSSLITMISFIMLTTTITKITTMAIIQMNTMMNIRLRREMTITTMAATRPGTSGRRSRRIGNR